MLERPIVGLLLVLITLAAPARSNTPRFWPGDRVTLARAAGMRASSPGPRASWLTSQPDVRSVTVGIDGKTILVNFRDGLTSAILPSRQVARSGAAWLHTAMRFRDLTGGGRKALVLEPFASELSLGPHAGDVEASQLRYAGYTVDEAYDRAVTVETMSHLSSYSVVYMLTHAGVNQWGEGVIATGQMAGDNDPSMAPLIADGHVMVVGVAGTSFLYYGILSAFIRDKVSTFPAGSLVFVNGCGLLRASLMWQAFRAHGVAALVSWDYDALAQDDSSAAAALFGELARGRTVDASLATTRSLGLGTSAADGKTAHLGYLGDGTTTLAAMQEPLSPTPAPRPTSTPASPQVSTPSQPSATATAAAPAPAGRASWVAMRLRRTMELPQ